MDNPSVEAIFNDYMGRRAGIIRALTDDVDEFFFFCNPDEKNLSLYGYPDGSWEVTLPADEVPPDIPEPSLGINFVRDEMARKDWLSMIAVHSDSWLLSVAFFLGGRFTGAERRHLFSLINEVPTVYEEVSHQRTSGGQINADSLPVEGEGFGGNELDKDNGTLCGSCGGKKEFWIACDVCERWFHGKCVQMKPAKTESIKKYKCPDCNSKGGRQ